jgi:hypothetical protein
MTPNTRVSGQARPSGNGIKLPFDAQETTRSIVRVRRGPKTSGCGFVVAEKYVITAAHCMPRIPRRHFDDQVATTIRSWDGSDETHLVIIHCDLISDIAILSNETLSGTEIPTEWAEGFDRIVARTGSARIDLSFPVDLPLRFYICTHKGVWLTGSTEFCSTSGRVLVPI